MPSKGSEDLLVESSLAVRRRCAQHAEEIRAKRMDGSYDDVPVSEERPMSNYPEVVATLDSTAVTASAPPVPKLPSLVTKLSFRKARVTSPVSAATPATIASVTAAGAAKVRYSHRASRPPPIVSSPAADVPPPLSPGGAPNHEARRGKRVRRSSHPDAAAPEGIATSAPTPDPATDTHHLDEDVPPPPPASPKRIKASRMSSIRKGLAAAASVSSSPGKRAIRAAAAAAAASRGSSFEQLPASSAPGSHRGSASGPVPAGADDEKQAVNPGAHATVVSGIPRGPQVRDPVDLAVEKLVGMGFTREKVMATLAECDSGHAVDWQRAMKKLVKEREKKRRLERLDRMG